MDFSQDSLELKHVKNENEMEEALKEAKSQLIKKKYDSQLKYEGYTMRIQYGMAFCGKKALITAFRGVPVI